MKEVIIIRHGEKQDDELTDAGIRACVSLAKRISKIDKAISSERNRAVQTANLVSGLDVVIDKRANVPEFPDAEIMGLTQQLETNPLGIIGAIWQKPELIDDVRLAGEKLLDLVKETLGLLSDSQRALIVSHDGTMIGLEKLARNVSFDSVNHSYQPLEGILIDEAMDVWSFSES